MSSSIEIRPARYTDMADVMKLVDCFLEESVAEFVGDLNKESMFTMMKQLWTTSFVLLYEGNIVGVIGGQITISAFTGKPLYQEMIWYVKKSYRRYGLKLLKHIEEFCREKGIPHIVFGHMANLNDEKMRRFYERAGYSEMEVQFIKTL